MESRKPGGVKCINQVAGRTFARDHNFCTLCSVEAVSEEQAGLEDSMVVGELIM